MLPISLLLMLSPALAPVAHGPHIEVTLMAQQSRVAPGDTLTAGVLFKMDPDWHVYWQHPGDSGQPPNMAWQLPEGFSAGAVAWPLPRALPVGPLMNYGYAPEVLLTVPMQVAADAPSGTVTLATHVTWLVCAEQCIPGRADLGITLVVGQPTEPDGRHASLFEATRATLPVPLPHDVAVSTEADKTGFTLRLTTERALASGRFFPTEGLVIEEAAAQAWQKVASGYTLHVRRSEQLDGAPPALRGLLVFTDAQDHTGGWRLYTNIMPPRSPDAGDAGDAGDAAGGAHADTPATQGAAADTPAPAAHPLQMIWFALLGGIILNLMPCVFPVLSIKVMSLVRLSGHERRVVQQHAWLYALGILTGFWLLTSALLALRAAGERIGWGFQLQAPGFVTFLAVLLFMFGLSLLGVFEVGAGWMGVGQSVAGRRDAVGSFFTGLLATVVATPCSAPFMGSAVGFALTQAPWICVAVFTALGCGLALPYVALCYLPQLARWMPKPGAWMQSVQQFMGFLLLGTVIWLLWVLERQTGSDALFVLLALLLCLAVAAWVLGRWGHHHRAVSAVAWLGIAALSAGAVRHMAATRGARVEAGGTGAETAAGLTWEKFSPERVRALRAQGRRIFVDFTAAWCVSCQVNEKVVFGSAAVREKIAEKQMVLLKADWTDADPVITEALAAFGRSGVPLYVLYGRGEATPPVQLPEVITPAMVLDALGKLP